MKNLLLLIFLGTTLLSFGQQENRQRKMTEGFSTEQKAMLKTKKMTLAYDLTKSQQEQMLNLNKKWIQKIESKKSEMKSINKEEMSSTEKYNHLNAMLDSKIAHQNEVKSVLNKDQFEQWKMNSLKMDKKRKGRASQKHREHKEK